jgi:hypothetical protein
VSRIDIIFPPVVFQLSSPLCGSIRVLLVCVLSHARGFFDKGSKSFENIFAVFQHGVEIPGVLMLVQVAGVLGKLAFVILTISTSVRVLQVIFDSNRSKGMT